MNEHLLSTTVFLTSVLAVCGVGSLLADVVWRDRGRIRRRINENFRDDLKSRVRESSLFKDLQRLAVESVEPEPGIWGRYVEAVTQSRMAISPAMLLVAAGSCALIAGATAWWLTDAWWMGAMTACMAGYVPLYALVVARERNLRRLSAQLPEAFEIMSRALRAGQTMSAAFQIVATDFESPIADEFAYCHEQQNLGLSQDAALRDMARRNGVMELRMFVMALLVHRQTGGNPVEILTNLARLIRKRAALEGKVRAVTSEGRMQAVVLMLLPPLALIALLILNRDYAQSLLDRPAVLAGVVLADLVGAMWIRRIMNFEY